MAASSLVEPIKQVIQPDVVGALQAEHAETPAQLRSALSGDRPWDFPLAEVPAVRY